MKREKEIKWLYGELPVLIEQKILSEEAASKIKSYYGAAPQKKGPGLIFVITGVLGALLIGAGIVLLFAHNWEELSRAWRAAFSFLPLIIAQIIYGYVFFKKKDSDAWTESSAAFLMMMLASSIALISQTYNLGGTLPDFIFTCMVLSIPLMYFTNSSLVAIFYLAGICYWATNSSEREGIWYLLLLAAAVPHLYKNISPHETTIRGNMLGWTLSISLFVVCFRAHSWTGISLMNLHALVFTLLYLLGKILYKNGSNIIARPFQSSMLLVVFGYSLFFSYEWYRYYFFRVENSFFGIIVTIVLGLSIVGLLALHLYKRKKGINYFVIAYPVLLFLCTQMPEEYNIIPVVLFNIYLLAFGIFYIWWGIHSEQISFVNVGMFLVSGLLAVRFFDQDISFIVKGIVFIIIGVSFLAVNLVLSKHLKSKHEKGPN